MTSAELIASAPAIFGGILLVDFLRYFIAASVVYLLVWHLFAKPLAGRKILSDPPKPGQMWREFKHSMLTVVIFASFGFSIFVLYQLGLTRIYEAAETHGPLWFWSSLAVILIVHDAWFYWTHRLLHRPWWFARFHSVHHQSVHPTPWAAYSFHPVEAMIQALFYVGFVMLVPMHPTMMFVFVSVMIVRNVAGHSAYELMPWRAASRGGLRWLLTNSHHHFHHARGRGNFGLYFTGWDRWMGTEDRAYIDNGDWRFLDGDPQIRGNQSSDLQGRGKKTTQAQV